MPQGTVYLVGNQVCIVNCVLKKVAITLAVICVTGMVHAQWRGLRTTQLGPAEGLNMRVNRVVQGPDGHIYLGGTQGLVRYDGDEFELFAHNPDDSTTIGPGEVYNLIVGSDGLIWIGLRYGGLNSFNPISRKFQRNPLPKLPYFMTPTAHGLLEDDNGCLWVGGHHFQLLCFDRESREFIAYQPDWIDPEKYGRRLSISSILQDVNDPEVLWLSVVDYSNKGEGGYGIVSFDKRSEIFKSYPNAGRNYIQDSLGNLFGINVKGEISEFSTTSKQLKHLLFQIDDADQSMTRGILSVGNTYWVSTGSAILEMDNNGEFELLYQAKPEDPIEFGALSVDAVDNVWIGSTQGVTIVNPRDQNMRYFSLDQFDDAERIYPGRLAYDSKMNILYLSHHAVADGNRLYRIPLNGDSGNEADYIETNYNIDGIAVGTDDRVWLTGNGQMHEIGDDGKKVKTGSDLFDDISIPWLWNMRTSSTAWIGGIGDRKFIWYKYDEGLAHEIAVQDLPVWDGVNSYDKDFIGFNFSRKQEVAYLVSSVVHRLDLRSGSTTLLKFDAKYNPNGQPISDAVEDIEGNLWIAGIEFTGKFRIEGDSLILLKRYTVEDGLASSEIHELFVDQAGKVWLFTTNGINCIDAATDEVRYFGVNEGLPQIYIDPRQVIETPDGRIVTVNRNGIIVFDPELLWNSLSPRQVKVVIKAIRVNGKDISSNVDVNYLDTISVPISSKVIDIRFQGLSYPTDNRLTYSYRLGAEEDWINIGHNKLVTLPALSPGHYSFEVKAGSPASVAPVRGLVIHIPASFYQQLWFIAIVIAILIGGIYLFYRYRIRAIRNQEEAKTEVNKRMAELELKALRSQINPHFMFNSLNSIKDFILQAETEKAAEYLSDFAHLIRRILQHSREKVISLKDELETLILYIDLEQLRFDNAFVFNCIVDDNIDLEEVQIPPMLLQPYIENAIWHGLMHKQETGNLTLNFSRKNSSILCVIDDDGIGRDRARELKSLSAVRYKSMGMGITKDRIEILNKMNALGISVIVEDKIDPDGLPGGTKVTLRIPAEKV
jgi:ligand-binding sensor domain-containing protein/uncharacterized membrane-anchored protein YhcB (DUF1043 family)